LTFFFLRPFSVSRFSILVEPVFFFPPPCVLPWPSPLVVKFFFGVNALGLAPNFLIPPSLASLKVFRILAFPPSPALVSGFSSSSCHNEDHPGRVVLRFPTWVGDGVLDFSAGFFRSFLKCYLLAPRINFRDSYSPTAFVPILILCRLSVYLFPTL